MIPLLLDVAVLGMFSLSVRAAMLVGGRDQAWWWKWGGAERITILLYIICGSAGDVLSLCDSDDVGGGRDRGDKGVHGRWGGGYNDSIIIFYMRRCWGWMFSLHVAAARWEA